MSRLIAKKLNWDLSKEIDHIKGNRLDHRESKLRSATRSQNESNKKPKGNNTSGYKNISWHRNTWEIYITVDGKTYYIGSSKILERAIGIRNAALTKLHGEFSNLG